MQSAPIPAQRSSARPAYIAATMASLKEVLDEYVSDYWFKSRQMYEINNGISTPKHSNFDTDFAAVGQIELR